MTTFAFSVSFYASKMEPVFSSNTSDAQYKAEYARTSVFFMAHYFESNVQNIFVMKIYHSHWIDPKYVNQNKSSEQRIPAKETVSRLDLKC